MGRGVGFVKFSIQRARLVTKTLVIFNAVVKPLAQIHVGISELAKSQAGGLGHDGLQFVVQP